MNYPTVNLHILDPFVYLIVAFTFASTAFLQAKLKIFAHPRSRSSLQLEGLSFFKIRTQKWISFPVSKVLLVCTWHLLKIFFCTLSNRYINIFKSSFFFSYVPIYVFLLEINMDVPFHVIQKYLSILWQLVSNRKKVEKKSFVVI